MCYRKGIQGAQCKVAQVKVSAGGKGRKGTAKA